MKTYLCVSMTVIVIWCSNAMADVNITIWGHQDQPPQSGQPMTMQAPSMPAPAGCQPAQPQMMAPPAPQMPAPIQLAPMPAPVQWVPVMTYRWGILKKRIVPRQAWIPVASSPFVTRATQ